VRFIAWIAGVWVGVVLYGSMSVAAQSSASVAVLVRDEAGALVPGAHVTLRCDGAPPATRDTNQEGTVRFDGLPPAACTVTATFTGFAPADRSVVPRSGSHIVVGLTLRVGAVAETLTVEGAGGVTASVTRMAVPLIETPQAIQVLPREVLETQQVLRVTEAARNVSGVTRAIGFNDAGDKYTIRGFLVDYSLKNGFKNNSLLTLTDVANIEQVEILKGPASIAYGRVEPGGIVNVVTRKPAAGFGAAGQFVVDRFGLVRPSFDLTGPLNDDRSVLFRVTGDLERTRSHREGVAGTTSFLAPAITWQAGTRTIWSLEGEYLDAHGVPDAGLPLDTRSLDLPVSQNLGQPSSDAYRNRNVRGSAVMTRQLAQGWLLTGGVSTLFIDARVNQVGTSSTSALSGGPRATTDTLEHSESIFPRLDVTGRFRTGRITHVMLAGMDGGWEDYDVWRRVASDVSAAFGAPATRERRVGSAGVYFQDQISLTSKWRLLVGGRFDAVWLRSEDTTTPPAGGSMTPPAPGGSGGMAGPGGGIGGGPGGGLPGGPGNVGGSDVDIATGDVPAVTSSPHESTPRVGLVYMARPELSLYVSYARSFNPPVLNLGTTSFDPTRSRQWEGGVKFSVFGSRLQGSTAVFELVKHGQGVGGVGRGVEVQAPSSTQRSKGVELDVQIRPSRTADVIASYAFVAGRRMVGTVTQTDDGRIFMSRDNLRTEPLINSPPHSGSVWAVLHPDAGGPNRWTFGAGAQHVGERRINIVGDFVLPSYTRLDAMAAYAVSNRWTLQLNLKNVGNRRYYETDGHFGLLLPAAPISADVAMRFAFR